MAAKNKKPEILEWTIHEQLEPGEPLPDWPAETPAETPPAPTRAPVRGRRRWLGLAGLAALVALAPWLYLRWQWGQTETAVTQTLQAAAPTSPWPPVPGIALAEGDTPALAALTQLSATTYRADIARRYLSPDGRPVTFARPQFLQRTEAAWEALASPPADFPGAVKTLTRPRFELTYYTADAALIEDTLAPYLEGLFPPACQVIVCPDDFQLTLDFVNPPGGRPDLSPAAPAPGEPWLFALLDRDTFSSRQWFQPVQRILAPHQAGIPQDAEALALWKRSLGLRALTSLALASSGVDQPVTTAGTALLAALTARLAARLGVESGPVADYALADPAVIADYLRTGPESPLRQNLDSALTVLNAVLRGQPEAMELKLWRRLANVVNTEFPASIWLSWAARAAGVSAEDYLGRLRAAAGEAAPAAISADQAELALACSPTPQLYGSAGLIPLPLLDLTGGFSWMLDWSADGRQLATASLLGTTVADLAAGTVAWPPVGADPDRFALMGFWLAGGQLAYNEFPPTLFGPEGRLTGADIALQVWAEPLAGGGAADTGLTGVLLVPDNLRRSPDRRHLAVFTMEGDDPGPAMPGRLAVWTVGAPTLTPVATGAYPPAWSSDSRRLAFVHRDEKNGGVSLHVWELATPTFTRLWNSQATAKALPVSETTQFSLAWSPTGEWLALGAWESSSPTGWLALLPAAGGPLRVLETSRPARELSFSYDGQWLAALRPAENSTGLAVYSVETGAAVTRRSGRWWQSPQWAPHDNRLLVFADERPYLIARPGAEPEPLGEASCSTGAWRP